MTIVFQPNVMTSYQRPAPGTIINGSKLNIISRTVGPSEPVGIYPGQPVFQASTHDRHCSARPAAGIFLGIAVSDLGMVTNANDEFPGQPAYSPGDEISILARGTILAIAASNVTHGDAAYVIPSASSGFVITGQLTDAQSGATAIPASWNETALAGAIVQLRVFGE